MFRNISKFLLGELLAPRLTPKLEDYPLSSVRDCLLNIFPDTLHNWRPFLPLQPEEAPCHGDRYLLIVRTNGNKMKQYTNYI